MKTILMTGALLAGLFGVGFASMAAAPTVEQAEKPATEPVLRGLLDDLGRGKPKFDQMEKLTASLVQEQLPTFKTWFQQLGALQSVTFKGNDPNGGDVYEVKYANGMMNWEIGMTQENKVAIYGIDKGETH